jgi:signal transduction histidine kinase
MLAELTQIDSGWLLVFVCAVALAGRGVLAGKRRIALNEALHELRRPLQALVLATPGGGEEASLKGDLLAQTALALEHLDRAINRGPQVPSRAPVAVAELLESAHRRWRRRAQLAGASLELRLNVGTAIVAVDRIGFTQVLDNLIINAIEHGGPRVVIDAELKSDLEMLRLKVTDSGRAKVRKECRRDLASLFESLSGRRRHGHGLRLVRRVAAASRGEFELRCFEDGAEAILELPLATAGGGV